jgi:hypothetical protein
LNPQGLCYDVNIWTVGAPPNRRWGKNVPLEDMNPMDVWCMLEEMKLKHFRRGWKTMGVDGEFLNEAKVGAPPPHPPPPRARALCSLPAFF